LAHYSALLVSPGQQGHGIGHELLKRTFEHAEKTKATVKALITFTFNSVSHGLYIRHGLFPRCPIYNFKVAREAVVSNSRGALLRCAPLTNTVSHLRSLAKIDAQALGVSRAKHHRFLTEDSTTRGILLYRGVKSHRTPTPCFACKNDPSDGAETRRRGAADSGAEPVLAGAIGEREIMRGS
jgi:hypothetical protein